MSDILSSGVKINYFYIVSGVAHIDLSPHNNPLFACNSNLGIGCVAKSILSCYKDKGVGRVVITQNNGKLRIENTLFHSGSEDSSNNHYALLYLFDVNTIDLYPYLVSFDGTAEGLISQLVKTSLWNSGIGINSFELKNGTAYIDMNDAFGNSINGLMSESNIDCVTDTIRSFYNVKNVSLTIGGNPFESSYE